MSSKKKINITGSQGINIGNNNTLSHNSFEMRNSAGEEKLDFKTIAKNLAEIANQLGSQSKTPADRRDVVSLDEAKEAADAKDPSLLIQKLASIRFETVLRAKNYPGSQLVSQGYFEGLRSLIALNKLEAVIEQMKVSSGISPLRRVVGISIGEVLIYSGAAAQGPVDT